MVTLTNVPAAKTVPPSQACSVYPRAARKQMAVMANSAAMAVRQSDDVG